MAAALKQPATRRAAAASANVHGDLWTHWVAPRYRELGVAVEDRVGATKPAAEEATDDGEEGPEETPEWVVRLTTRRDLRVGRARRAAKATGLACCYYRTSDTGKGNATSVASGRRHRQDMDQRKPGRKAAPGSAKKGYISRNCFEVLMREVEAGELDACEEMFQEGAEPERDTKLEPQRQTLEAYIELAETEHRRARASRQEWPAVVRQMDAAVETLQDGETFAEPERDSKFEPQRHAVEPCIEVADTEDRRASRPALVVKDQEIKPDGTKRDELVDEVDIKDKHLERRLKFCFAKDDRPVLLKTNILKRVQVQRPDNATAATDDAPRNPLLGADRRAYRRTTGGPGRDGGGGWGSGGGEEGDGGGRTYRDVGPDKTPVPRARCQGARCRNPAKRYCSGCHSIYCPGCGCDCDPSVLHYVLPQPILVGDCEIHHRLSDPFPDYPYVLVSGVRSLLHGRVDYTFASVHDIFRIEGIEPDIPVLVCRLKDMGPFSWTAHPLTLVPGTVARTDLFR